MASHSNNPTRKIRGGSLDMVWELEQRKKIQNSKVLNRLIQHVEGEIKLDSTQAVDFR
jgi:hypothetical protein